MGRREKPFFLYTNPESFAMFLDSFTTIIESKQPQIMVGPYYLFDAYGNKSVHMGSIIPVIEKDKVDSLVQKAKENGPISKLLNTNISVEARLNE